MSSIFVSTNSISSSTRTSIVKLQSKLVEAQKEVSTGRLADVGTALGYKTGQAVSLRHEHARLQAISDTNGLVASRLQASQTALDTLAKDAQSFLDQLVGARNSDVGPAIIQDVAKSTLSALTELLNTTYNGASLFAGINTDVQPVVTYSTNPPSTSAQSVATAFTTAFGVTQSDPAVQNITSSAMQTFLDGAFSGLFDPAAWSADWSSASDQNIKSRISTTELIETSVNANEESFRKLARAYTMLADLGTDKLNLNAYQAVIDTATRAVSEALQGITELRGGLGTAQERVNTATERISIQVDIMTNHIGLLEGVDPYEASTRLSSLLTQVETAYSMTARIQKLSLLNYLPIS